MRERRRDKIVSAGWAIWYLFGSDACGEYLRYYVSHRMTNDRHVRICETGQFEFLPAINSMRLASSYPEEDAKLEAGHRKEQLKVARMLEAMGFSMEGDKSPEVFRSTGTWPFAMRMSNERFIQRLPHYTGDTSVFFGSHAGKRSMSL